MKLNRNAYTDCRSGVLEPVYVVSYDNDKYATVRFEDGTEQEIKRGYVYRNNTEPRRWYSYAAWHEFGGGSRKTFRKRKQKTMYHICADVSSVNTAWNVQRLEFTTKQSALHTALDLARKADEMVTVVGDRFTRRCSSYGLLQINVYPDGVATQTNLEQRRRLKHNRENKYLRGYGKLLYTPPFLR